MNLQQLNVQGYLQVGLFLCASSSPKKPVVAWPTPTLKLFLQPLQMTVVHLPIEIAATT